MDAHRRGRHRWTESTQGMTHTTIMCGVLSPASNTGWHGRDFQRKGPYAKISQALIPASGTTGPGNWYTLSWQELMMIAGDIWDQKDEAANEESIQAILQGSPIPD